MEAASQRDERQKQNLGVIFYAAVYN